MHLASAEQITFDFQRLCQLIATALLSDPEWDDSWLVRRGARDDIHDTRKDGDLLVRRQHLKSDLRKSLDSVISDLTERRVLGLGVPTSVAKYRQVFLRVIERLA